MSPSERLVHKKHKTLLPVVAASGDSNLVVQGLKGLLLAAVFVSAFYFIVREIIDNRTQRAEGESVAKVLADMSTSKVLLETVASVNAGASRSSLIEDIKFATKGDGTLREVDVNGKKIDSALVKLAAFENRDFVLRDEAPQRPMMLQTDQHMAPQKSHFREMTFPLVFAQGKLGNDIVRDASNLSLNIAETGGRN